jgi:hypothetical protein
MQPPSNGHNFQPLLQTWCDGLLAHQIQGGDNHGGLNCPACGILHGRCGDAVYPLLAMFSRTRDEKYRRAALDVFDWSERHVSQPDGSFLNDCYPGAWKGITCFSALAIGEALRHYGEHLSPATHAIWLERLRDAADFLLDFMDFEIGDLNYPISTAAALALSSTLLGDEKYQLRARELAYFGLKHGTENGLLWGEGPRGPGDVSPRGLRPVDVSYNVEESLPNLALYGELTGDETILEFVTASLRAHLPWLLPDGGWDAGWCSRQYKWSYWGSRTTDGCALGFALLQARDSRFARAATLNLRLLESCTHDGLLFGGPHLHARGIAPCVHHTFCHAKGLAAALDAGFVDESSALENAPDGVREWSEAAVFQVVCGAWRASITANDLPHTAKRGGYPSGGALSLLWHQEIGPLCVASMNDYVCYEPTNMQSPASEAEKFVLTPRLEVSIDGEWFSSLHDGAAQIEWREEAGEIEISASGVLKNQGGAAASNADYQFVYRFTASGFEMLSFCALPNVRLVFPLVSLHTERVSFEQNALEIRRSGATVQLQLEGAQWENAATERVFNFVPGVEALPLSAIVTGETRIKISIQAQASDDV